jgi:hypothetical protein
MSNDAHVQSFADAGFGMGGAARSMMFGTIITTRMRGGGG